MKYAQKILTKIKQILDLLESHGNDLDELQKAQVLQSLINAKQSLEKALGEVNAKQKSSATYHQIVEDYRIISDKIEKQTKNINFTDVQNALVYLEEGVSELINRKNTGEKIIKE